MASEPLPQTRVCTKCGIEKPLTPEAFRGKAGKLLNDCRDCHRAFCKVYYQKNRDRMLQGFRDARAANPEFHRERDHRYKQKRAEQRKVYDKQYREANRDRYRERMRAWEKANPERKAAYGKAYRAKHPEAQRMRGREWSRKHRDRLNAKARAERRENPEKSREYCRRWRSKNPERANALMREWYHRNKAKVKEWDHRRREANGSGITFTSDDLVRIFENQRGSCFYCRRDISASYEVDHFIPIKHGGGHEPENIVLACMPCNRSKGAKLPWEWKPSVI